jgi:hypothetical protein
MSTKLEQDLEKRIAACWRNCNYWIDKISRDSSEEDAAFIMKKAAYFATVAENSEKYLLIVKNKSVNLTPLFDTEYEN